MSQLTLHLLGPPRLERDGKPIEIRRRKALSLLIYLAVTGHSHSRDALATLFWPELDQSRARVGLRRALTALRKGVGESFLGVDRENVGLNRDADIWLDVDEFRDRLAECQTHDHPGDKVCPACLPLLAEAAALYRDDFLAGFTLPDSPTFDEFQFFQAEELRAELASTLERLARAHGGQGRFDQAIAYARRWLALDPLREPAHRCLMQLYAGSGQRAAALRQYEECERVLQGELGVSPEEETAQLYQTIRVKRDLPPPVDLFVTPVLPQTAPLLTPDVDREAKEVQAPSPPSLPPVQLKGERRLATIILADIKGSTALGEGMSAEDFVEILNHVFQILGSEIYRYGGEIDQFRGDGLVAFFGAKVAHEDDPERAVLAALAMQEATRTYAAELAEREGIELLLRVGVNTGEVIAARIGDSRYYSEDTAMGQAVALANRLQTAAEPGTVLVSESTYRLTQPLFEWQPLGEITVKGVSQPVAVYRPLAARAVSGKPRGIPGLISPLVGRQAEFRALQETVERLLVGVGGIVTIVGEAGIGKSRLVAEQRKRAQSTEKQALRWVEGRCLSYGATIAYQLWLDVLRALLGIAVDAPRAVAHDALEERVQTLCSDCFDDVLPYLARMMALPLEDEVEAMLRGLGAEGLKTCTFRAVETLIKCAAQQRPLVIVCEDLHWADPTSIELLGQLLALSDRTPLLFICVLRPERKHGCWQIKETAARRYHHRHTDLCLDPLSTAESQKLVGNLLQVEALPQKLRARILSHAEGNPFYVEEIIRSLMDSGAIAYDEAIGCWRAKQEVADIVIPDTLHGVQMARIDRLQQETKRILQLASIIGRIFLYRVLAEIAREERELDKHLLTLQREEMIRERTRMPELEYIFKHQLTREAAYNGLLRRERRLFHRQVAEALERLFPDRIEEQVGLLAHHWQRAEEPEQAIPYLLRAGDQARTVYANDEAIEYFCRALALLDKSSLDRPRADWRLEAMKGLGRIHLGIGKLAEAEECLQEAIALGKQMKLAPRELVRLYHWLGEVLYYQGRFDERLRIGEEGLALLGNDTESVEAALMNQTISTGHRFKGDLERSREFTFRTAQFIRRLPYSGQLRGPYAHIITVYREKKDVEEAMEWLQALEKKAGLHHDSRALGEVHYFSGRILYRSGNLRGAISRYQRALGLFTRIGDAIRLSRCLHALARIFLSLGRLEKAEEYAYRALEARGIAQPKGGLARVYYEDIGQISLCQGDTEKAIGAFVRAGQLRRESNHWQGEAWTEYLLGRAHLAQGDCVEALRRFQEATIRAQPEEQGPYAPLLVFAVSGLEEAYRDSKAFRTFCRRFWEEHPAIRESTFIQWFLKPTTVRAFGQTPLTHDDFATTFLPEWVWHDPFDDCSFTVQDGLEIHAANGRDLWYVNWSAPRLLRPASGDLAVQASCFPTTGGRPAIGGLLLWKNRENYLRLDRGVTGEYDVLFGGCLRNQNVVIGRGQLPLDDSKRAFLRLERIGERANALCSTDGVDWFTVGHVTFPVIDPIQVGLHAIGNINRTIHHGAYPDGTAIRFESFQLWAAKLRRT